MQPHSDESFSPDAGACCPRCGYDLRGVIGTWREHCPVDGICSECGLEFHWRDVFVKRRPAPAWSIEHGDWRSLPVRFVRMLMMMARPWRFWSQLQMHHPVRLGRIVIVYFILGIFAQAIGMMTNAAMTSEYAGLFDGIQIAILRNHFSLSPLLFTPALVAIAALMPVCFITVPVTLWQARVRWVHVARIALLSFMPFALVILYDLGRWIVFIAIGRSALGEWMWHIRNAVSIYIIPPFLIVWWGCAIRRYLKMRQGFVFALCAFIMSTLIFALIMVGMVIMSDV